MATSSTTLLRRFISKAKFRHMEVILRVAELGSMRHAADAVGMTQPSISQLVRELETLLETELFFRHARGVEPTEAAKELLPVARRILSALGDGSEILANRLGSQRRVVRIAASEAGMLGLVHPILPDFAKGNRHSHIIVDSVLGRDPLALLTENACDILCIRRPEVIPKGWTFESCLEDSLVIVCGPMHPLAQKSDISMDVLGEQRWLMNRVDSVARARFEQMFEHNGWSDETRCNIVTHMPELTRHLLATGSYLALMSLSAARPYVLQNGLVILSDAPVTSLPELGFVWEAETASRAVLSLAAHLKKASEKVANV